MMHLPFRYLLLSLILVLLGCRVPSVLATEPLPPSKGQTVYVPAYSHIYHGNKETPLLLAVTLSIRNVDMNGSLTVTAVNYYESKGSLVRQYLKEPLVLGPLGSERFVVPQKDEKGGSGANFIVEWRSEQPLDPPIIETIMIGTQSQLGISFTSRGQAIRK